MREDSAGISRVEVAMPKKGFFRSWLRIWLIAFLVLAGVSYVFGFMNTETREMFLAFLQPPSSDSKLPAGLLLFSSRGIGTVAAVSAPETWSSPKIVIPKIAVDSPIILSSSRDLDVLNKELTKGVIHYPDSAMPGRTGNVILFGHSSLLPVHNPALAVFTRANELKPGDVIDIYSDTKKYSYAVTKVEIKIADDTRLDFESDKKILTLSTCDILGGKESRYVVTAEFLETH
ncbi:MAG: class E sortase [Candidatus Liptonbacteria bacterium]|nr:class E sortase [Candidatus Liptonbacteria bacterium]